MQDCAPAADVPDPSDPGDLASSLGTDEHYLDCRARVNAFFQGRPHLDPGFADHNTLVVYQTEIARGQLFPSVEQLDNPQSAFLAGLSVDEYISHCISQTQSKHNKGRWRDRGKRGVGRGGRGEGGGKNARCNCNCGKKKT